MPRPLGFHTPWKHTATGLAPLERTEQARTVKLYRTLGCKVYSLSQYRPAKVSSGLPDLLVFHRGRGLAWTHELKAIDGRVSKAQQEFAELTVACHLHHVVGGYDAGVQFLQARGFMAREWQP